MKNCFKDWSQSSYMETAASGELAGFLEKNTDTI